QASGNVSLGFVASGAGNVDIDSTGGAISASFVSASGGDALLTAPGSITTGGISASNAIDVDSTAGGALDLGTLNAGTTISLDTAGALSAGRVLAGGAFTVGGARAPSSATFTGPVTARSVNFVVTGAVTGQDIVATSGALGIVSGGNISIRNASTSSGPISLTSTGGSITTTGVAAIGGDAILTAAQNVTASGTISSDANVSIGATNGAISTVAVTAGNAVSLAARTTVSATGPVSGKAVDIAGGGNVTLTTVNATAGKVGVTSTGGSISTTGATAAGGGVVLSASQNVTATGAVSSDRFVFVSAASGAISATSVTATGGDVGLAARGPVTTTGKVSASGAIDIDSTGGGALTLGQALTGAGAALQAGTTINLDTTGAVIAGGTTAGGALRVGTVARPSSVTFTGPVSSLGMTVTTNGTFTTQAAVDARTAAATVTAGDVAIGGSFKASDVVLRASGTGGVALGSGPGVFALSDAELDRIDAATLTIDAGGNAVNVRGVSLTGAAGSQRFDVLTTTTGTVHFDGNFTADGAGRVVRFGGGAGTGPASATGLASRITADIDNATINLGQATLDLRATDIAFGQLPFLNEVKGRGSQDLAFLIVGNSGSSLFNPGLQTPLSAARASDPVYLRAGNLSVSYANSALFQNTGSVTGGVATNNGAVIGSVGGGGTLRIDTLDPTNTFALFGQINNLVGPSAAIAGEPVIFVDDTLQRPFSRINGCQIGSGADCLNATVGTTTISLPREAVNPLSGDTGLLVPFDPLVGTNNEGLFSDAASDDQNLECPRDERGVCVERQGDN
ncbi:beta strand repeat-containing protein, partial [Tsuneonella sp. SYSU-LHT278]|uniref:beta strand repeat-containing protein n=1 Tax=Tsuneonella sediminis TaxID=3416089 RepID=UPI003F7A32A2